MPILTVGRKHCDRDSGKEKGKPKADKLIKKSGRHKIIIKGPYYSKPWGHFLFYLRFYLFIFRERGGEGEREGAKHPCVRDRYIYRLPLTCPQLGTWPASQEYVLTGSQLVTLWFSGGHSIHWDTSARAHYLFVTKTVIKNLIEKYEDGFRN